MTHDSKRELTDSTEWEKLLINTFTDSGFNIDSVRFGVVEQTSLYDAFKRYRDSWGFRGCTYSSVMKALLLYHGERLDWSDEVMNRLRAFYVDVKWDKHRWEYSVLEIFKANTYSVDSIRERALKKNYPREYTAFERAQKYKMPWYPNKTYTEILKELLLQFLRTTKDNIPQKKEVLNHVDSLQSRKKKWDEQNPERWIASMIHICRTDEVPKSYVDSWFEKNHTSEYSAFRRYRESWFGSKITFKKVLTFIRKRGNELLGYASSAGVTLIDLRNDRPRMCAGCNSLLTPNVEESKYSCAKCNRIHLQF